MFVWTICRLYFVLINVIKIINRTKMERCTTEIALQTKSEHVDEDQKTDENNQHSNIMIDSDDTDNKNDDKIDYNQQSHNNNSLCIEKDNQELLGSIKSELSLEDLLIETENHTEKIDENNQHSNISLRDGNNESTSNDNSDKSPLVNEQCDSKFECNICKMKFKGENTLKSHLNFHFAEKPYHCNRCGKRFTCQSILKKHLLSHGGTKHYQSNVIGKKFTLNQYLKLHSLGHTDDRPYQCDICNKKFKLTCSLKYHLWKQHTMEKLYQCHICSEGFWTNEDLKKHCLVHRSDKPFPVNIISVKKVQQPNNEETRLTIENHIEKTYENSQQLSMSLHDRPNNEPISNGNSDKNLLVNEQCNDKIECNISKKKFEDTVNLKTHLYSHAKTQQCNRCNRKFILKSALVKHLLTHVPKKISVKNFANIQYFKRHLLDDRPYQCNICSLKFKAKGSLEGHLSKHHTANTILHPCNICGKMFWRDEDLEKHPSLHAEGGSCGKDQSIDDNNQHSNIIIDNDEEIKNNDNKNGDISNNNQQSRNNSLCTIRDNEELFGFMKDELNIDETCIKIENHTDNEDEKIFENNEGKNEPLSNDNSDKDRLVTEQCNNDLECNICNQEFRSKENFKMHLYLHAATKTYHCNSCNKKFVCESSREEHQLTHIRKERYQCNICGKQFGTASWLKQHSLAHNNLKPYQCAICNRKYKLKFNFEKHLTSVHTVHHCNICGEKFWRNEDLEKHSSLHAENHSDNEDEKIYENNQHLNISLGDDNNGTISNDNSDKDLLVNEQCEEFKCNICDKKFRQNLSLRMHLWIHAFHYCNICNKKFRQKKGLALHLLNHRRFKYHHHSLPHIVEKPYQCNICNRKFELERSLNNHLWRKHGVKKLVYRCNICDKKFWRNEDLEKHSSLHADCEPGDEEQNTGENDQHSDIIIDNNEEITNNDNKIDDDINYNQQLENNKLCTRGDNQEIIMQVELKNEEFSKIDNHPDNEDKKIHENHEHPDISLRDANSEPTNNDSSDKDLLLNEEFVNEQFQCNICNKKFKHELSLRVHLWTHSLYRCTICAKKFKNKRALNAHSWMAHNR